MITELFFENNRNKFVDDNKDFINGLTQYINKGRLMPKEDMLSQIAVKAFNEACDTYEESMGSFYRYAEAVIKKSMINYCRTYTDKFSFSFDTDEPPKFLSDEKYKPDQFQLHTENMKRSGEIQLLKEELSIFDFTIESVSASCPKNISWRNLLLNAALLCSEEVTITDYMRRKMNLPVKKVMNLTGINRRLIEKHKQYLIMLIILFSSDEYLYIKSYLNIKVEEKYGQ